MKSKKVKNHWEKWLKKNLLRFNYPPILIAATADGFVYQFKGITKQIELVITFDGYWESMLWFYNEEGKNFDHKVIGYESIDCLKEELICKVFEPLIHFSNQCFTSEYQLYLVCYGDATEAFIEKNIIPINTMYKQYSILEYWTKKCPLFIL